jgi:hypothetical protein
MSPALVRQHSIYLTPDGRVAPRKTTRVLVEMSAARNALIGWEVPAPRPRPLGAERSRSERVVGEVSDGLLAAMRG